MNVLREQTQEPEVKKKVNERGRGKQNRTYRHYGIELIAFSDLRCLLFCEPNPRIKLSHG